METFIQPKITGYRQLSAAEASLMNEIKLLGQTLDALVGKVDQHLGAQAFSANGHGVGSGDDDETTRLRLADPRSWVDRGARDLQLGLMSLTRAVAQPTSF